VQKPHPPVIIGGAFPHAARRAIRYGDGWVPHAGRPQYSDVTDFMPQFREMATTAGRGLDEVPVTVFGAPEDLSRLRRYQDRGIARVVVGLPSAKSDEVLPVLDRWAELIRRLG
jgi:alkanesulfonate monooxygenase SsuD/methylene tetrahydromethanopterin reductase-like flavin-dependent oxidoreductase (luciferase family)